MRVSSLSDERVISLLSKYFVPVWVSRDDYQLDPRSKAEQAELERIDSERSKRGFKGGTVCVFLLDADGSILATMPVQLASKPDNLVPLLTKVVAQKQLSPRTREAIRATAARSRASKPRTEGGRIVHIWTRCDQKGANRGLSQDRIELTAEECKAFAPPADARPEIPWRVPDEIAHRLFQCCYPPGPIWRAKECKVRRGTMTAELVAVSDGEARLQLQGEMELLFPYMGKPTDGCVTAHLIGLARWHTAKQTLTALDLVSERAEYVWYWQGKPQLVPMRIALELEP
jgi:hypothetical protein